MSRDFGPTELRVYRTVLGSLGVLVFAFLLLSAIEFLFSLAPPVSKVDVEPDIPNATYDDSQPPSQSSPPVQIAAAESANEQARGDAFDEAAGPSLSSMEVSSERLKAVALERAIHFDPRPLELGLGGAGATLASAVSNLETFQPPPEGIVVTPHLASAEPPSVEPPKQTNSRPQGLPATTRDTPEPPSVDAPKETNSHRQELPAITRDTPEPPSVDAPKETNSHPQELPATTRDTPKPSVGAASLSRENVRQIQARLRELGFLSSANTGEWDASSRDALRDFKLVNHLPHNDKWDVRTGEKLHSQTAVRADRSFIGNWSTAPCRSATTKDMRLSINSRRTKSSTGSVCKFNDIASDNGEWRVQATCSQGDRHWTANGKLALTANKLVWSSEQDVTSYFRCN